MMTLKKSDETVSFEVLLPVAMVGYALFWAWFVGILCNSNLSAVGGIEGSITRAVIALSMATGCITCSIWADKVEALGEHKRGALAVVGALPYTCLLAAESFGAAIPPPVVLLATVLIGLSFSSFFIAWGTVLSNASPSELVRYIPWSIFIGICMYLLVLPMSPLLASIIVILLPCVTQAVLLYILRHVELRERPDRNASIERYPLLKSISFTNLVYSIVFGFALYILFSFSSYASWAIGGSALLSAACLAMLIRYFLKGRHIPLGLAQRVVFPMIVLAMFACLFAHDIEYLLCGMALIVLLSFYDVVNLYTAIGMVSKHDLSPYYHIPASRFHFPLGFSLGLLSCSIVLGEHPDAATLFVFILALIILIVVAIYIGSFARDSVADAKKREGGVCLPDSSGPGAWSRCCASIAEQYKLSPREEEVLVLLAKGRNSKSIQDELVISEHTVKTHIHHIYRKMQINSHQDLIAYVEKNYQQYKTKNKA